VPAGTFVFYRYYLTQLGLRPAELNCLKRRYFLLAANPNLFNFATWGHADQKIYIAFKNRATRERKSGRYSAPAVGA
jgi:hypothetical protein